NIFFVFLFANALILLIYVLYLYTTPEKKQLDLYDQYIAAAPAVVRTSPEDHYNETVVRDYDDNHGYDNNDVVTAFRNTVETVTESLSYDRVAMEVSSSKSYRKTRSEKKARMVEYHRRTESERVTKKTASWRSQTMEGMSSDEFRMTVETFIMQNKRMLLHQYGVAHQPQNDVVDYQWQNGVAGQWLPEQEYGGAALPWQNGVPHWQNGVVQWQGRPHES
ncbi:hypothetical protein EUTSA_v10009784mg, partial [Eutrema salsugineum]